MKVLSIFNRKGGVGKTSITKELAFFYSQIGMKVLCIDCDSQMNLSQFLTSLPNPEDKIQNKTILELVSDPDILVNQSLYIPVGKYKVGIKGEDKGKIYIEDEIKNLFLIMGNKNIEIITQEMFYTNNRDHKWQFILKNNLKKLADKFDLILIDNPPSETPITVMSLIASDATIAPTLSDFASLNGLDACRRHIEKVKKLSPNLKNLGCFINMYKARENTSQFCEMHLSKVKDYNYTGIKIRSSSKISYSGFVMEGVVNVEKYLNKKPQTNKISDDIIELAEYITEKLFIEE